MSKHDEELECLNLDELDVEDLERRIELAPVSAAPGCTGDTASGGCPQNNGCGLCTKDFSCSGDIFWGPN